jgi:sulfoxide reductase heme-binding subunit YedZ
MLKLKKVLFWINCFLPVVLIASYFVDLFTLYELGEQIGRIALFILWLVLLPGIIRRLEFKGRIAKIGINLKVIRRMLGIIVFQLGVIHYFWMAAFFYIKNGLPDLNRLPIFQTFGFLALLLFVPLAISSNDFFTKLLKKYWFWLHRLVYISALLLVFHLGFNGKNTGYFFAIVTEVILLLELVSWLKYFLKNRNKKESLGS